MKMSKFFVALIFQALISNCICGIETEGTEATESDHVGVPDSTVDPMYRPLILIVKNTNISVLFDIYTAADENRGVPFSKINMVDEEGHQLQPDEQMIYLCPHKSLPEQLRYMGDLKSIQAYEFETHFDADEPRHCTDPPVPLIVPQNRGIKSCDVEHSMKFCIVAIPLAIPVIETSEPEYCYRRGIKQFIHDIFHIQGMRVRFEKQLIELFQVCYDKTEKRTEWTIRWIKPSSLHLRQHVLQKIPFLSFAGTDMTPEEFDNMSKAYKDQEITKPLMMPHKLVPTEENTTHVWNFVTSHVVNLAPLWQSLSPFIDLIDERLQRFCNRISRPIKVMTKSFHLQKDENDEKRYVSGNRRLMIPHIWAVQAYDEDTKSAVTIVLHNTPDEIPQAGELCHEQHELVSCEFKKWGEISPKFRGVLNEHLVQYVYCCKTTKFPMIDDIDIEHVIDINFDKLPENHGDTPSNG